MIPWSTREQIVANLLKAFVALQTVRIVIDATEYFCEKTRQFKSTVSNMEWVQISQHI